MHRHVDCLVGPVGCEPLIGQIVLEALDLIVDCSRLDRNQQHHDDHHAIVVVVVVVAEPEFLVQIRQQPW